MEKFNRTLRGYDPVEVNNFLDQVIKQVEDMVDDIKKKVEYVPIVSPNYTMEIGSKEFHNSLTHQDVVNWRSSTFIDIMAKNNLPIVVAPFDIDSKCQYLSKYSLKMCKYQLLIFL